MNRIKKLVESMKKDFKMFEYEIGYMRKTHFLILSYLWHSLRYYYWYLQISICKHDFVDEGYATRESGCIEIVCSKCGYSANIVILY